LKVHQTDANFLKVGIRLMRLRVGGPACRQRQVMGYEFFHGFVLSLFCEAKYLTALHFYKTPSRLLGKKIKN
jgi:hypothetical protein